MINRHLKLDVAVESVCVIFNNMANPLLRMDLLMLDMLKCQLLLLILLVFYGEVQDEQIYQRLDRFSYFFSNLHQKDYLFPPQPLLARRADEQIEEDGGNEEIESQISYERRQCHDINYWANMVK
ncbi:MAG: hypothetical protein EZS28_033800 [Streblomastix strix]|uniref:Uncharacterized protein n=1 Tax=Streblomastix strix TaxID=222440 RepID=A0A5J4UKD3_9EUKA|nr:MAG: hypothetical protein EZS28_033800 [Streblomastix strix]